MEPQPYWPDLARRGFLVIRSFFSAEEIARMRTLCKSAAPSDTYYVSLQAPEPLITLVADRLQNEIIGQLAAADLQVDTVMRSGLLFPTEQTQIDWHTDHKSYYVLQSHRDYVNFWIPIEKPVANKSGLVLLPLDRLQQQVPEVYRAVLGRGAADFKDGWVSYELDGAIARVPCPVNLEEIGEAPDVVPGDVIVLRGDVPHRTQDAETRRIALSIRAIASRAPLDLMTLLMASPKKADRLLSEPRLFLELVAAFLFHRRTRVTVAEYMAVRKRIAARERLPLLLLTAARGLFPSLLTLRPIHTIGPTVSKGN